ncbi:MAG: hypothetical protein QXP19_05605 [Thermoproteota archaeon]
MEQDIERMKDRFQIDSKRRKELVTTLESIKNQLQEHSDLEPVEGTLSEIRSIVDTLRGLDAKEAEAELDLQRVDQKVKELAIGIPQRVDRAELEKRVREGRRPLWPLVIGSLLSMFGAIASFLLNNLATAIPLILIATALLVLTVFRVSKISSLTHLQELYTRLEGFDRVIEDRDRLLQKRAGISKERRQKEEYLSILCTRFPRYSNIFYEMLRTKFATIQEELSKLPTQEELEDFYKKIKALEKMLEEIQLPPLPENIVYSKELEEKTSKQKEELAREIEGCRTKISLNNNQAEELEGWLNVHGDVWERLKQQEETVAKLERELRIVKKALEGIQTTAESLMNRVKPNVEAYMGIILPSLTNGRYKAAIIDENYNVQVWDPDAGQYRIKEVFSGGTEDQFLLTLRLAFALSLIPEVKGQKPEFIFLDEPLGSSDEVRRSGIIEYLNTDLSNKFRQIFIISHVGGLEEQLKNIIHLQDGRVVEEHI